MTSEISMEKIDYSETVIKTVGDLLSICLSIFLIIY